MRFVLITALALCAGQRALSADESPKPPNIVFLLADDLGWTGLGCYGSDLYETPNLDNLAESGLKFTDAYAACTVCSPTRASIMTGMYPARLRLTDFITGQNRPWAKLRIPDWTKGLKEEQTTLAEALRDGGYATAHIGKWHLSFRKGKRDLSTPEQQGFDLSIMKPPQARGYFLPEGFNQQGESSSDYLTDYFTDQAVQIIDRWQDRPFFLYMAYHTPHTPIQGRPDLVESSRKKIKPGALHNNPEYAAMVQSLDQSVGRILDRLKRHGLDENTIVIFTSDNGGLTQRYGKLDHFTDNHPLRRGKGSAYEGGVRVPAIVRWPGHATPGSVCDEPIMTIDYFPTLVKIAGIQGPIVENLEFDGRDISPLLQDPTASLDRDLFWHYPHYHAGGDSPYSAIRSGNWRLIEFHEENGLALYDLDRDIGEQENLAEKNPQKANELRDRLHRWRKSLNAQMPTPNPDYDPQRETELKKR